MVKNSWLKRQNKMQWCHGFCDDLVAGDKPRLRSPTYRLESDPPLKRGIYAHHHYHSTAHEVLGVASGSVRVRLGGDGGKTVVLRAEDVVVVPAGVAHKSEGASPDLVVVGAYPPGRGPDMRTPGAPDHERAVARVAAVPLPRCDPVYGMHGLL